MTSHRSSRFGCFGVRWKGAWRVAGAVWLATAFLAALSAEEPTKTVPPAASPSVVERGPSTETAPFVFDRSHLEQAAARYVGHDAWYLLWKESHELLPGGDVVVTTHTIAVANNRHALDLLGDSLIWFDPSCEQLTLNEARLHKRDGSIRPAAAENLLLRDDNSDPLVLEPEKQLIVSFTGVEVGDAIEVKWTRRISDPQLRGELCWRHNFSDPNYPIDRSELVVRIPRGRELRHAGAGQAPSPEEEVQSDATVWRWVGQNVPPAQDDEHAPHDWALEPVVEFSTFGGWEEVAALVERLRSDRSQCTQEVLEELANVTDGKKSPAEKLRALAIWARDSFRYLSVHHGAFGFRPHPPGDVLARRFGDCKDLCHLLYIMLRHLEIKAEMVFLNTAGEPQLRHDVPTPLASHVVLRVELDGEEHWIDPTSTTTAWNRLRTDLFGRRAFAVSSDGLRLMTTPDRQADLYRRSLNREAVVALDASVDWRAEQQWSDYAADDVRTELLALPADQRRSKEFEKFQIYNPRARLLKTDPPMDLGVSDEPLKLSLEYVEPPPPADVESVLMRIVDRESESASAGASGAVGCVSPLLIEFTSQGFDVNRQAPWRIDGLEFDDRLVVRLPAVFEPVAISGGGAVASPWGAASLEVEADEISRQVVFTWRLACPPAVVSREQFQEFQTFLDAVDRLAAVELEYEHALELSAHERRKLKMELMRRPLASTTAAAIAGLAASIQDSALLQEAVTQGLGQSEADPLLLAWKAQSDPDGNQRRAALEKLIASGSYGELAKLALASELLAAGEKEQALRTVRQAANESPFSDSRWAAALIEGRCLLDMERYDEALAVVEQTLLAEQVDEAVPAPILQLQASIHAAQKNWPRALDALDELCHEYPDDWRAHERAIELALSAGEPAVALRWLRRLQVMADDDPALAATAARLSWRCNRMEDAEQFARAAIEADPQSPGAETLILVRHRQGRYDEVLATPRENLQSAEAFLALIDSCQHLSRRDTLREVLKQARQFAQKPNTEDRSQRELLKKLKELEKPPARP